MELRNDPDREVRITVAGRLPEQQLELLVDDPDYLVRVYVAKRLPAGRLFRLAVDPDNEVRRTVAERLPSVSLGLMVNDTEVSIRRIVAQRLDADDLTLMIKKRLENPAFLVLLMVSLTNLATSHSTYGQKQPDLPAVRLRSKSPGQTECGLNRQNG